MTLLDAAVAYCRSGLAILPAHPIDKRPLAGKGRHGRGAPFPDEDQVRGECARAEAICILCGAVSGNVECIDFDDGGSAFAAWRDRVQSDDPALYNRLVLESSPSGGIHVVYRCAAPVSGNQHLAVSEAGVLLIETRGEGALFLCAPSPRYKLLQGDFTSLPVISAEERERLLAAARALGAATPRPAPNPAPTRPQTAPTGRVGAAPPGAIPPYLARAVEDEAAKVAGAPEGQRNRTLNTAALKLGHYVGSGALPEDAVVAALENAAMLAGLEPDEIRPTLASGLAAGIREPKTLPPPPTALPGIDTTALSHQAEAVAAGLPAELADPPAKDNAPEDPGPTPESLARIPGFISDVMDYTLDVMPGRNPILAFCGALALQAHLAGRKMRSPQNNRTNFYILALADPGSGKDWPRKTNQRILDGLGLSGQIAGRFASGEGIQDALIVEPAMLFQPDEIDSLFQAINKSKDGKQESAMAELLTLYTSADTVYPVRRKANADKTVPLSIDQPCLNLLGTAPPKQFYEALSERMLTNGLFARLLVVEANLPVIDKDARIKPVPDSIMATARWWAAYRPLDQDGIPGNLSDRNPHPTIVPMDDDAIELSAAWRRETLTIRNNASATGDLVTATIWSRTHENSLKLALAYALSANYKEPRITLAAAEWARAFTSHQTRRMQFMAHMYVSVNEIHAGKQTILRMLQKAPGGRLTKSQITNRTPGMRSKERDDAIDDLAESNLIVVDEYPTQGRRRVILRLARSK